MVLVPASASARPGDPACPPDKTLVLTLKTRERGFSAQLVTKHEQGILAEWSGEVGRTSLTVPAGVDVLKQGPARLLLKAPLGASLPVTATWEQAIDPSAEFASPTDPETRCSATQTVALPILAPRPSKAAYNFVRFDDVGGYAEFALVTDSVAADLSPLSISIRSVAALRFPSSGSRAIRMPVPMTAGELRKYRKRLPNPSLASTPEMCRAWWICSRLVTASVHSLADRRPGSRITKRYLKSTGLPLPSTQPYRRAAPFGVKILAYPGSQPPALGYDIQVRQSGRLVARVRRAIRCRKDAQFFNNLVCRTVKSKNG